MTDTFKLIATTVVVEASIELDDWSANVMCNTIADSLIAWKEHMEKEYPTLKWSLL